MWNDNAYELIDFGAGRKLERFGERRIIRTSPAAIGSRPDPTVAGRHRGNISLAVNGRFRQQNSANAC